MAYDDCGELLSGLRKATAAQVGPYGLAGGPIMHPLAPGRVPGDAQADKPAATPHSDTNVQEPGVDEPDLVKTDGRRIVTTAAGRLHVVDAASRKETGTVDLGAGAAWSSGELLLSGDRALVVLRPALTFTRGEPGIVDGGVAAPKGQGPRLVLVDLSGPPRVVSSLQADGAYVDARQVGSVARVIVRSAPRLTFPRRRGGSDADATAADRAAVRAAPLDAWLPRYSVTRGGRTQAEKVPCAQVSHPASYTGLSLVSVLSVDLTGDMADAAPVSVVAGGQTVYGSGTALYVTDRPAGPDRTDVYRFDTGGSGPPRFAAAGSVPGAVLNQYSLSEYAGNLRVATTSGQEAGPPGTPPPTESAVYVLARRGAKLVRVGMIGGLGHGERIYAVRFAGPAGYVVTFRQTDPLYALDLRDPAKPRATGELKLSGYSAYLHPAGDGRLIGVGQQADANGRAKGLQVALFDVRDPAAPRRISGYTVGSMGSMAEFDPHAFLYWPQSGLTVLPLGGPGEDGALALSVTPAGVHRLGHVTPPKTAGAVQRALVVGDTLWTLTPTGLQANDLTGPTKTAWLPFA
ncbi:beta-propeller domain-containing protein [Actinomadura sp. DC4]|uniref:beta-propeller domain-containing protein n=1 Tax=Actinomadura sp. DC4 TaxID=3055069 RepID=UPI0025B08045|nr:beta-propeller domain-containing protein [Actinomadura sp. DC4]MDN3356662.1 beta-propeller domain-containing protein [Actinomadura sp. DC4]